LTQKKKSLNFISRNFGGIGEILEKLRIDYYWCFANSSYDFILVKALVAWALLVEVKNVIFAKHLGDLSIHTLQTITTAFNENYHAQ